ncbi:uncharacterized [Tachysurus ichikawai]
MFCGLLLPEAAQVLTLTAELLLPRWKNCSMWSFNWNNQSSPAPSAPLLLNKTDVTGR